MEIYFFIPNGKFVNFFFQSLYGLTETSPVVFQSLQTDTDLQRSETVGYPQEHLEVIRLLPYLIHRRFYDQFRMTKALNMLCIK